VGNFHPLNGHFVNLSQVKIMLEHSYFSDFDDHDVIAFSEENLYKSKKLKSAMADICTNSMEQTVTTYLQNSQFNYPKKIQIPQEDGSADWSHNNWTGKGVHCEVLKLGSNQWQKGKIKIRVSVEFYPDEPETPPSPLDEFRQNID
jgi:hypothetical protein